VIKLLEAIGYIVNTDSGAGSISSITGRPSGPTSAQIVEWGDIGTIADCGIALLLVSAPTTGADRDTRLAEFQFTCLAKTIAKAWALSDRLEAILTSEALWARGVNAAPTVPHARDMGRLENDGRLMKRVDLVIAFDAVKA
jgi:hypothetical protein